MSTPQDELAARLRELVAGRNARQVKMFGGISFMVDDRMVFAARRDGDLLVHIDPAWHPDLIRRPGAHEATMGADRPMGPGWITVSSGHLETEDQLRFWAKVGLDYGAAQSRPTG